MVVAMRRLILRQEAFSICNVNNNSHRQNALQYVAEAGAMCNPKVLRVLVAAMKLVGRYLFDNTKMTQEPFSLKFVIESTTSNIEFKC
jgi:hypothetical protein